MNRSARSHRSTKIPNVKLRPAHVVKKGRKDEEDDAENEEDDGREDGLNAMDRNKIERMEIEDGVVDAHDHNEFHSTPSHRPFHNHVISFTSVMPDEKYPLSNLLKAMGIKSIESNLTTDCTILISRTFTSPKYACALGLRMPVFKPEWIEVVHERYIAGDDVGDIFGEDYSEWRLKAFEGAKIAVTGIEPVSRRNELIDLVKSHGGIYSKNLDRTCTHLVVANPTKSSPLPEKSAKVGFALKNLQPREIPDGEHVEMTTGTVVLWEGWAWDSIAFGGRFEEEGWDLRYNPKPPKLEDGKVQVEARTKEREKERQAKARVDEFAQINELLALDESRKPGQDLEVLEPARVRPAVVAVGESEKDREVGMARGKGKGKLVDDLLSSLLGNRSGVEAIGHENNDKVNYSVVNAASLNYPRPKLMATETVSDLTTKPTARPSSMLHASRHDSFAIPQMKSPIVAALTPALGPTVSVSSSPATTTAEYVTPGLFSGLRFAHAIKDGPIQMEQCLRECGGTIVSRAEREDGEPIDYFVVRLSGNPTRPSNLSPNTQIVTECWIERCMFQKEVVSPDEEIYMRPLPHPTPLQGASGLQIHFTGFDLEGTFYTKRLVQAIGGCHSLTLSRKITTHLLCQIGGENTAKVAKAYEWGKPVVTYQWLLDSIVKGAMQPVEPYAVPRVPELLNVSDENQPPQETIRALPKSRLLKDNTANLSLNSDGNGILGSAKPALLINEKCVPASDGQESMDVRRESQRSSASSRRLGLAPTEINILPEPNGLLPQTVEDSMMEIEREPPEGLGGVADLRLTGRSTSYTDDRSSKQPTPEVHNLLTAEVMQQLERADVHAQQRQVRPLRRTRPVPGRSGYPSKTSSGLFSSNGEKARENDEPARAVPMDISDSTNDPGDESIRVVYADPQAERERKRLMEAFGESQPRKTKRTRAW